MLTLRQIEVIRAIMVTGTIAGAAKLLNVSAPGLSRLMKHTEDTVGVPLFLRRHGRYVPTPEARDVFDLLDNIHRKVEDLQGALDHLGSGEGRGLRFASVPSIANAIVPRTVERLRRRFPGLSIDFDILMVEQAIDYLLLGRGEVVAVSARFDHSIIDFAPLVAGRLVCIVPAGSALAEKSSIRLFEIAAHPLIGSDAADPLGRLVSGLFREQGMEYRTDIRTRFGATMGGLVAAGQGIAVVDEFTVAHGIIGGIHVLEIEAETSFQTYAAYRNDLAASVYAEALTAALRDEMTAAKRV
jgi:DNA-binding transcriptional LysR family regulator